MMRITVPDAPIKVEGFPLCSSDQVDGREVAQAGDLCNLCGGPPASLEILRRSMHRQARCALAQILACYQCKEIPPHKTRCSSCSWFRGGIMGIAGIGEQAFGPNEFAEYLKIISIFNPGWQKSIDWNWDGKKEVSG